MQTYLEVGSNTHFHANNVVDTNVSSEWASGDNNAIIEWESNHDNGVRYHKFWRENQNVFGENGEIAAWGNWYWATGDQVSYACKLFLRSARL